MELFSKAIQLIIALGLLNVWILRFKKPSSWRGGSAKNMKEEFEVYGLPSWFMSLIGFFKIFFALMLIIGLWFPSFTQPAAIGIVVLMLGAIAMHIKVKDSLMKSLPAFTLFVLSTFIVFA